MTNEGTVWRSLAAPLAPAEGQDVLDCCSIGEQEGALDLVVSCLIAHEIPISEDIRAQLVVTAETWRQREALEEPIGRCRRRGDDDSTVHVLAAPDAVP